MAGPPGVGKSAILDAMWPRKLPPDEGSFPSEWAGFIDWVQKIAAHDAELLNLANATIDKVATVSRAEGGIWVQAGLAQIGMELAWRLPELVEPYYRAMPVSAGVVFMFADVPAVQQRNRARGRDLGERVPAMERAREIGVVVLSSRVPLLSIDTGRPIDESRTTILEFVNDTHQRSARLG